MLIEKVIERKQACECGCGQFTTPDKKNRPRKFVKGHQVGEFHQHWKGGRIKQSGEYIGIYSPGHPRADRRGYVLEHLLMAEKALGRPIPKSVEVHHVNRIKSDNSRGNLVICNDNAYHDLLHTRTEALQRTGNAHARRCWICDQWDAGLMKAGRSHYHRACQSNYAKALRMRSLHGAS